MNSLLVSHLLNSGQIAVIPTDTVYGVVAGASDQEAVARLYKLKHREAKPGTLIAANIDQLTNLGIDYRHLKPVEKLWPAAVSVVVPCDESLFYIHQGVNSLAVRIPDSEHLRELLSFTGPLITSSANQPGQPPATTIDEARAYFGDKVEWYEDGGVVNRDASTVIEINNGRAQILRQGAFNLKDLDEL
ncbi:Sua5/YciO/YrdC/YwlC family protein [bacterium]|nr:MAG: Sua5/YciO/YrdC/YwlC family protein [bacterium]